MIFTLHINCAAEVLGSSQAINVLRYYPNPVLRIGHLGKPDGINNPGMVGKRPVQVQTCRCRSRPAFSFVSLLINSTILRLYGVRWYIDYWLCFFKWQGKVNTILFPLNVCPPPLVIFFIELADRSNTHCRSHRLCATI